MSVSRTARLFYLILNCLSRTFLIFSKHLVFKKIKAEKEGFEPSRRVNDLLPFQGSPFGQLGYFSKLPYLLSSSDIYLCRSQRQVILYLVSFMLSSTFLTFFKKFLFCIWQTERVGFEPTRPCGQTVFKTASLWPLRYLSICCFSTFFVLFCQRMLYSIIKYLTCQ